MRRREKKRKVKWERKREIKKKNEGKKMKGDKNAKYIQKKRGYQ